MSESKPATPGGNITKTNSRGANWFFAGLLAKQQTVNVMASVSVLVLLLHIMGLIWLRFQAEQTMPAQPPMMEIKIIPVSALKPKAAPPPPPTPAKLKPALKKPQPKPTLKKMPVVQENTEFAPTKQVLETQAIAQNPVAMAATTNEQTRTKIEPFIEADISADYAENPKPNYPSIARGMGWQGKVMLKVQVSDQGLSDAVEVERSSGYEILDESDVEAIKQWRFTPAKRGETPIASSVIVPIIFTLQDQEQS